MPTAGDSTSSPYRRRQIDDDESGDATLDRKARSRLFFARAFADCALMFDRGSVKFSGQLDKREAYSALKNQFRGRISFSLKRLP